MPAAPALFTAEVQAPGQLCYLHELIRSPGKALQVWSYSFSHFTSESQGHSSLDLWLPDSASHPHPSFQSELLLWRVYISWKAVGAQEWAGVRGCWAPGVGSVLETPWSLPRHIEVGRGPSFSHFLRGCCSAIGPGPAPARPHPRASLSLQI